MHGILDAASQKMIIGLTKQNIFTEWENHQIRNEKIDNCPILWIWMLNTLSVVKLWETGIYPMIDVLHCVKSVCIGNYNCLYFLHLDWIWRDMESTCGKYGQEWLRIRILFMQCCLHIEKLWTYWILSCKFSMIIFLDFLTILLC